MIRKYKKGLTLIEVVISLAILAIIISPVLSMSLNTTKITKAGDDKLRALATAQECMEEVKDGTEGIFSDILETETFERNGYRVVRTTEPEDKYIFGTSDAAEGDDEGEDSESRDITYDLEISVNETKNFSHDGTNAEVTKNLSNYTLTIENNNNKKDVKVKVNLSKALEETEKTLEISITNHIPNKNLEVYFVRNSDEATKYVVKEVLGKVKVISNVFEDDVTGDLNYRLYKVTIKVFRTSDSQELQALEGYKTFLK